MRLLISMITQTELSSGIFHLNCSSEGDCIFIHAHSSDSCNHLVYLKIFGTEFFHFEIKVNFINAV